MLQGFTRCAPNTPYTSPSFILVSGTVLRPVSGTVLRPVSGTVLHSRFQPCSPDSSPLPSSILVSLLRSPSSSPSFVLHPRLRNRSPSSSLKPSSILVFSTVHRIRHRNCSPSPYTELFHRNYSALFIRFVSQPRSPQPPSVHVFSSVLRLRHLNHSPSSSPELSTILVTVAVLHPRPCHRPPFSSPEPSSTLVSETVLRPVTGTVLHPRLRYRSPSPFSAAQFFWM